MIKTITEIQLVSHLFEGWDETMIWSCLQGIMGNIYSDADKGYASAKAVLGDFCCLAGTADKELLVYQPANKKQGFIILVPQTKEWENLIEKTYSKANKIKRYAFKKHMDCFDIPKLKQAVTNLDNDFSIQMIDEDIYNKCKSKKWSVDLVSQYNTYEMYQQLGLGVVILHGDEIVSGASSYTTYDSGIEVEIDTREDYRRKGLAYIAASELIIECCKRNIFPSWDAHNSESAKLAKKLGYIHDYEYTAFEVDLG